MQGTVHAIVLIVLALAVVFALAAVKRRAPTSRQFTIALAIAVFGTLAAPMFNHHMCREGEPRTQWLILGPCLLLVLLFVNSPAWRRTLGAAVFVGMMGLSCHFTDLVHEPGWTGNPDWDGGASMMFRSLRQSAAAVAADSENPNVEMPAGWLRELSIWPAVQDQFGDQRPVRRELRRTWHTRLTGLYRYSSIPQDFWYPGGSLADAITRLELRDRTTR
ncbi:MAG: hypothetical protein IPM13_00645 [Phycisphaerales bacterium]|nr:hypothetical protein [Phycisphaerales bacterium]